MWGYSHKKQTSWKLQCCSLIFTSESFSKGFFVLEFCCKYILRFLVGGILLYHKTLIFVQFLLFLVMVSPFSQNKNFNFAIFSCLNLSWSSLKVRYYYNTWWYCLVLIETIAPVGMDSIYKFSVVYVEGAHV